jgi:NADH dehydrogenase
VKLLVTGGAGFLGRHVLSAARARGHEVTALSRHPDRVRDLPEGVQLVQGDLTTPEGLGERLGELELDAVIHAAAIVVDHDPTLHTVNVEGTAALCATLCGLPRPPRLVHVSTFAVEDPPPTAYSDSKLAAEEVVRASGLEHLVLRPTLIYGSGDGTNTPILVEKMRSGTHWLPGGGQVLIQPVHVDDVAEACIAAAERDDMNGRTYRLGGGEPVSVRAWREAVRDASGGAAQVRALPMPLLLAVARVAAALGKPRARDVLSFHLVDHAVDSEDARRDLDFSPRSIHDGLAETFGG